MREFLEGLHAGGLAKGQRRLFPSLALVSTVLLAAWMGNVSGGYFAVHWIPAALVLAGLVLIVSVAGALHGPRNRPGLLALGLFTAYAAWTFASILWSANRGDAWHGAGQTLMYLLAFWVAAGLVALGASRRWALSASVLGPAVIAGFTLLHLGPLLEDMFEKGRLVGSVGYYNGEAAFLLVPLWVGVYLAGSRGLNPLVRGAVLAGMVLSVNLAVLAQSRGAMVALAVSLPVFFLFSGQRLRALIALLPVAAALLVAFAGLNEVYQAALQSGDMAAALERALPAVWMTAVGAGLYGVVWGLMDWRWRLPAGVVRTAGGVALAACAVALIFGALLFVERVGPPVQVAQQKWEAFKTNDVSGQEQSRYLSASGTGRYTLWQVAWKDFATHPVAGVGTQNYEATYYLLRDRDSGPTRGPHNLPLEVLGERGLVGGALFFGFLATCLLSGLRSRFGNLRPEGKAQVGALVAAVTYWFVHSSAEWFWQLPAVTLPAMIYLGLLVSPWRRAEDDPEPAGWPLRATGLGVAALALVTLAPLFVSQYHLARSQDAGPREALDAVERAQAFNPVDPDIPRREAEIAQQLGDWDRAEAAYEREIRLNPEHYSPYMHRAAYHERRGELDAARRYYQKALSLNPLEEEIDRRVERLRP